MQQPRDIIIIGAGFSGTLLAAQLLRLGQTHVTLVERETDVGLGVAYRTKFGCHLLNVPAAKMSAFPDVPGHFVDWLTGKGHDPNKTPTAFMPRTLYGAYLQEVLATAVLAAPPGSLDRVRDSATGIELRDGRVQVRLASGRKLEAARVVLALGNHSPGPPSADYDRAFLENPRYLADPWKAGALGAIALDEDVLLVGTGLTMVDVAMALEETGHRGRLFAVSRHGLLPRPHKLADAYPSFIGPDAPTRTRDLLRLIRNRVRLAAEQGIDWRPVFDSLRPHVQTIWQSLDIDERERFLRHARLYWDIHRHRVAPEIHVRIEEMRVMGKLAVAAGRVLAFHPRENGFTAVVRLRGSRAERPLSVGAVINCTGPQNDYEKLEEPLVKALRERGLCRPHSLRAGLEVGKQGELIDAGGAASDRLFALGALRVGALWETTAVPELRVQAAELARRLMN